MLILHARRTRRLRSLTRDLRLLPCRRMESKALRSVRRTSPASRQGMYTVPSLAVLGHDPAGVMTSPKLPSPRLPCHVRLPLACPDRGVGAPAPRPVSGRLATACMARSGVPPTSRASGRGHHHVKDVPGSKVEARGVRLSTRLRLVLDYVQYQQ